MSSNPVFSQRERNIIILIIVIVLGAILLYALKGIYGAILGTLVMYTLFRKLNMFLIEKWRWPKPLSAVTIIILSIFIDRKSTRLNSSHVKISYAVFCLKKK